MNFNIKKKYFIVAAYLYMVIPVMIFMLTWLKLYVGIPMAVTLAGGLFFIYKNEYKDSLDTIVLPVKDIVIITFLLFLWVVLSGSGKLFYETEDWQVRNAVFRDLINFKWPVVYEQKGTALAYYLLQWIVPAGFGKILGWRMGNIALLFWNFAGVLIVYMLLVLLCKNGKKTGLYTIMLIFIFFGGLNQVGRLLEAIFGGAPPILWGSEDGWLDVVNGYQYSSNYTLLSWVFNQTIVPWIAVPLVLLEKKVRNYAYIGLLVLPYAPLPFVGIFLMFLVLGIEWCIRTARAGEYRLIFCELFSIPNVCAVCSVFLCFLAYFSASKNGMQMGRYETGKFGLEEWAWLTLFFFLEVGVYALPLWKIYKKEVLFYAICIAMYFIPLIRVGLGRDFCMRAPIGLLFMLQIYIMQYLVSEKAFTGRCLKTTIVLITLLSLGGYNAVSDLGAKVYEIKVSDQFPLYKDDIKTLSDKSADESGNFVAEDYKDKFFYKYMAGL